LIPHYFIFGIFPIATLSFCFRASTRSLSRLCAGCCSLTRENNAPVHTGMCECVRVYLHTVAIAADTSIRRTFASNCLHAQQPARPHLNPRPAPSKRVNPVGNAEDGRVSKALLQNFLKQNFRLRI
jgi:hypothetical protein